MKISPSDRSARTNTKRDGSGNRPDVSEIRNQKSEISELRVQAVVREDVSGASRRVPVPLRLIAAGGGRVLRRSPHPQIRNRPKFDAGPCSARSFDRGGSRAAVQRRLSRRTRSRLTNSTAVSWLGNDVRTSRVMNSGIGKRRVCRVSLHRRQGLQPAKCEHP